MHGSRQLGIVLFVVALPALAATTPPTDAYLDGSRARWEEAADSIWGFAETALKEEKSSALLEAILEKEGFTVQHGVAGLPTAFVATAGSGAPVVALMAEYDALPGLSQKGGETKKTSIVEGTPGHGCAHNLLGTAAVAAAVAANRQRVEQKLPGTIKLYGTPAEEQLQGKIFMVRGGLFDGVDAVLAWHPEEENYLYTGKRLAITGIDVEFFGKTAHAAGSPWLGRSALDALELFDHAVSLMREHVLPTARLHRIIKNGGAAPNIIPDYTRLQMYVRDESGDRVNEMLGRIRKAVDGAAMATETTAKVTVLFGTRDPIYNDSLNRVLQRHLERVGAPRWDDADQAFARAVQKELGSAESGLASAVTAYGPAHGPTASSDNGDVSEVVPLIELAVATRPQGTPAHHWAQTTCALHPIGRKGMLVAAKVLAASAADLLRDPKTLAAAKQEWKASVAARPFVSPVPKDAVPKVY